MAWIEVHQAVATHRKTRRLAQLLGVRRAVAVGHLVCFWLWALDNAPDGNLENVDPADIKSAADWPRSAELFINALVGAGFVDRGSHGESPQIHDWHDYAGRLLAKRAANAERMRLARSAHGA